MAQPLPMACTLNPEQLRLRLAEISAVGADSFIAAEVAENRQVLRFRSDPETRQALERIVAAEAECCSFLELSVSDDDAELTLSIVAPAHGRETARLLAAAFTSGTTGAG